MENCAVSHDGKRRGESIYLDCMDFVMIATLYTKTSATLVVGLYERLFLFTHSSSFSIFPIVNLVFFSMPLTRIHTGMSPISSVAR